MVLADELKIYRTRRRFYSVADWKLATADFGLQWNTRGAVKRSETRSETRTALCNAVKRTVKHTVKHSAKRCNLQWFCVISRSKRCCIQKSPSFFLPASTKRRKLPRFVLCFISLRFTAPCAFHCIPQRCAYFTFCLLWVGFDDRVPCRMDSHAPQPGHTDCESESLPSYLHVCQGILVSGILLRPQSHSLPRPRRVIHTNHRRASEMYHPGAHPKRETTDMECWIPHHLCPSMDDSTDIPKLA